MYIKPLTDYEKVLLKQRGAQINELQDQGICFGCYNFEHGDIFPDEGLIFYEDSLVRCQFEKYPRATGQTIIVSKAHYEDISEMPLDLGTYILKVSNEIIKLLKETIGAKKVYMCTICDGKRNHLHFQLLPRLEGDPIGYENFVREEGLLMDYHETAKLFRNRLEEVFENA